MNPDACHHLIEDIVYHAIKDLEVLNEDVGRIYVDDDHRAICNTRGFYDGRDELMSFFGSPWFYHICDEFVDISAAEILDNIDL